MTETTAVDRFYDALRRGDVAAARACYTDDARLWHCFDGIAQTVEEAVPGWEGLVANTQARGIEDVRRLETAEGFVQQHMFVMTTPAGERKAWAVCLVLKIEGDRIAHLAEYIDRGGTLPVPAEGPVRTPGL